MFSVAFVEGSVWSHESGTVLDSGKLEVFTIVGVLVPLLVMLNAHMALLQDRSI
jgi:hypothetical protein